MLSSLFFLRSLVTVLLVLVLECWTTEEYCMLKWSAIFFGVVMYFPLNFIASFSFAFAPPFKCFMSLNSFVESVFLFSTVSLHFSLLCTFIMFSISLLSAGILVEVGFVSLRLSLSFILLAASVGTSGRTVLIRPAGMVAFEILLIIFLKVFSPL